MGCFDPSTLGSSSNLDTKTLSLWSPRDLVPWFSSIPLTWFLFLLVVVDGGEGHTVGLMSVGPEGVVCPPTSTEDTP